jgi:hypothetical protein
MARHCPAVFSCFEGNILVCYDRIGQVRFTAARLIGIVDPRTHLHGGASARCRSKTHGTRLLAVCWKFVKISLLVIRRCIYTSRIQVTQYKYVLRSGNPTQRIGFCGAMHVSHHDVTSIALKERQRLPKFRSSKLLLQDTMNERTRRSRMTKRYMLCLTHTREFTSSSRRPHSSRHSS